MLLGTVYQTLCIMESLPSFAKCSMVIPGGGLLLSRETSQLLKCLGGSGCFLGVTKLGATKHSKAIACVARDCLWNITDYRTLANFWKW